MEITGKIIAALDEQSGVGAASGKAWKKKEYILETFGNYPKKVCITFFGDKVDHNQLILGESYTISIDVESREYNGRWYTNINGYNSVPAQLVSAPTQAAPSQQPQPYGPAVPQQPQMPPQSADEELPF